MRESADAVPSLLQEEGFVRGLARAFQIQLLASDMALLERFRAASAKARQQATQALYPFMQRLWQQIQVQESVRGFVLQHLAQQPDISIQQRYGSLAGVLLPSIRAELLEAFLQALQQNAALQLSVHPTSYACARYLASLVRVWPVAGQYFQLPTDAWIKTSEHVEVAWQYPDSPNQTITAVQHELRAKTLMLLVALAATQAETRPNQAIFVGLGDLMGYFGYRLGEKANAHYYWLHVAEVVRALLHDLPGHRVRINSHAPQALLPMPQVMFRNPQHWGLEALLHSDDLSRTVREANILGFYVCFEPAVLDLLGINTNLPTREVPAAFCSLHGPCFWMAWRVVYWQYWANHQSCGLLQLLDECGYLEAHTRSGRIRYKDALKDWWVDVGRLIEIGLLHEPGVRIWQRKQEVSDRLSQQLEAPGRLGPKQLSGLEAAFALGN